MAESNQRFETFQTWVNKASSWLCRRGNSDRAICFDARGRRCRIGDNFMRARDESAFPVDWVWESEIGDLVVALRAAHSALEQIEQQIDYGQIDAALRITRDAVAAARTARSEAA